MIMKVFSNLKNSTILWFFTVNQDPNGQPQVHVVIYENWDLEVLVWSQLSFNLDIQIETGKQNSFLSQSNPAQNPNSQLNTATTPPCIIFSFVYCVITQIIQETLEKKILLK